MVLGLFSACSIEKRDIRYGTEACEFCKMIIVNQQFATELVTKKGKVHVYDSIECLLNDRSHRGWDDVALIYVSDYTSPGTLIAAESSFFLQSENIPSPMGENLSAFPQEEPARRMQTEKGGTLYHWPELIQKYESTPAAN